MIEACGAIYIVGAFIVTVVFVICDLYLLRWGKDSEVQEVRQWLKSLSLEYILFWPWRLVGFPIFILATGRHRRL